MGDHLESGTASFLKEAGVEVREVADLTGTLICWRACKNTSSLYFRRQPRPKAFPGRPQRCRAVRIPLIDMVVCNLYPFEAVAARGSDLETLLEKYRIGGVTLIAPQPRITTRSFSSRTRRTTIKFSRRCTGRKRDTPDETGIALKAFSATASYDASIVSRISRESRNRRSSR